MAQAIDKENLDKISTCDNTFHYYKEGLNQILKENVLDYALQAFLAKVQNSIGSLQALNSEDVVNDTQNNLVNMETKGVVSILVTYIT